MKIERKTLATAMVKTLVKKYEHVDIMEVYTDENNQKCIRFIAFTYSNEDGGYGFGGTWNENFKYRMVYCSKQPKTLLSDYYDAIRKDIEDLNDDINVIMTSECSQKTQDCDKAGFERILTEYILDNYIQFVSSKFDLRDDMPDGKYMIPLDIDYSDFLYEVGETVAYYTTKTFKEEFVVNSKN